MIKAALPTIAGPNAAKSESSYSQDAWGQEVISKPRAYIVISEDNNYCRVLPITRYGQRGVAKPGVVKANHAIVFTTDEAPGPAPGEVPSQLSKELPMQRYAIRIEAHATSGWQLDDLSRLNFADPQKIEHYTKVQDVGFVHAESMGPLQWQYMAVTSSPPGQIYGALSARTNTEVTRMLPEALLRGPCGDCTRLLVHNGHSALDIQDIFQDISDKMRGFQASLSAAGTSLPLLEPQEEMFLQRTFQELPDR